MMSSVQVRIMHSRVRLGLTGLAIVFLIVIIGAVLLGPEGPNLKPAQPGEPLAQLGVAPGASDIEPVPVDNNSAPPTEIAPPAAPVLDEPAR